MLRRIGLRTLLPLLNLALYVSLVCIGNARNSPPTLANTQATVVRSNILTRAEVALALNLPALATAFVLNVALFHLKATSIFWLTLPFVPLSWFGVGLWIDRRFGWLRRPKPKRTFVRDAFLVLTCLVTLLFVFEILKTILQQWRSSGSADRPWLDVGSCAWSAFLLTVLGGMFSARFFQKAEPASSQGTLGAE